ncbi:MAG TPA: metallophosphoesterase [Thermoanaerobaculia bacterium]
MDRRRTAVWTLAALLAAAIARAPALSQAGGPPPSVVVGAAGDIACDPGDPSYNGGAGTVTACRMAATSDLLLSLAPAAVLALGDNQYENGALAKYNASYGPSWGRLKAITHPIPGNHEYLTAGAAGYFAYFGAAAGTAGQGWYSADLGGWHLVGLNANCAAVGGCDATSPQGQWLATDLAAHPGVCTLAFWHHPRFSSGPHGNDPTVAPFWEALWAAGADLVLNGHDHIYERFAPQRPDGMADANGLRQFTAGTGGKVLTMIAAVQPNSEARQAASFGVLELALYPNGYEWRFVPLPGSAFADAGAAFCHSAAPPPAADFYTLDPPCRLADTRESAGPTGGPALAAGVTRAFPAAGACGVPAAATAVAANLTVLVPDRAGHVSAFPWGTRYPGTATVSFNAGKNRANNAIVGLGVGGKLAVAAALPPGGTAHLVVDLFGYFR